MARLNFPEVDQMPGEKLGAKPGKRSRKDREKPGTSSGKARGKAWGKFGDRLGKAPDRRVAYSERKLFTGLATAALTLWKLTVSRVMIKALLPAAPNTHQVICVRYVYCCNQLFIK
jgi:hypothetical protein